MLLELLSVLLYLQVQALNLLNSLCFSWSWRNVMSKRILCMLTRRTYLELATYRVVVLALFSRRQYCEFHLFGLGKWAVLDVHVLFHWYFQVWCHLVLLQLLEHANLLQLFLVALNQWMLKWRNLSPFKLRVLPKKHTQLKYYLEQLLLLRVVMCKETLYRLVVLKDRIGVQVSL